MTLEEAMASDRSRNLDLLRLVLASGVIVSHAWPLSLGPGTAEPLEHLTGHSLGGWAIGVFFFISGLLIAASAERKPPSRFWVARVRRIVPGLGAALFVTLALAFASGSTAGLHETTSWFFRALTLASIEHRLTDAFATNPYPEVVNGPLWSLFYEVLAYGICAAFVWMGGARNAKTVWALLTLAAATCLVQEELPGRAATFAPLFASFALGMAVYVWRDRIELRPIMIALLLGLASIVPEALALGVAGFALAMLALSAPVVALSNDVSYGMYIYGWPIAQTVVVVLPGISPVPLAVLSLLATYPIAFLSWQFVERPGLANRRAAA